MTSQLMPLIGVTGDTLQEKESNFYKVGDKYILSLVEAAGCLAVMIPPIAEKLQIDALLDRLDGVLFTGSPANINPDLYNAVSTQEENQLDRPRDATNLPLLKKVMSRNMPFFCICRGHQELNVVQGGTLFQHVHEHEGKNDHRGDKTLPYDIRYGPIHPVNLTPEGRLYHMNGAQPQATVNSIHEQAIDRLGENLQIEATAEDGTIEAVSLIDYPTFMMSVQWHPEHKSALKTPLNRTLFEHFGEACRLWHQTK